MRNLALGLSIVVLIGNIVPSVMYLAGRMDLGTMKTAMLWGTIAWYAVGAWLLYGTKPPKLDEPVVP